MQSSSLLNLSPTSYHKPKLALQNQSSNAGTYPWPRVLLPRLIHLSPSSMTYLSAASHQLVHSRSANFVPKATSSSLPESADGRSVIQSLKLGAMFAIWYLLNIYFNILNKQKRDPLQQAGPLPQHCWGHTVKPPGAALRGSRTPVLRIGGKPPQHGTKEASVLQIYPFPATVSAFQFGCGSIFSLLMWALNLHTRPNITYSQMSAIVPLAIAHATGNLLTNISLAKVAVSFTHTIKALEPLFTVVLSSIFLGQSPSPWVVSSLVPIVGGVALASLTEVSFNWIGFYSVMVSNLVNQSRNVFSKKFMDRKEETLDDINLFSIMTIMAFLLLMPAAILIDGVKFTPSYFQYAIDSQGMTIRMLGTKLLLSALCLHYYQQVSYVILLMVSPVTHSVGNCLKRVVVIVSSVIFFQTPVSHVNSLGTTLALIGVFLYTRARKMKPKLKA